MIVSETDQLVRHKLRRAIELLPKRQREDLYLRYFENLTYEEIAQVMGLQRQAVANYLQKLCEHWHQLTTLVLLISRPLKRV
jgi:RNA polymerase sigma factor (sigma-70 family)